MDYTEIPRSLIYKERTDLKDFGVQILGTLNNYLFTQMRKLTLLHCGTAKEIALQCLNNAYYICTLIQLDDFPDLSMDKYERKLLEVKIPFIGDVYQASMALVCLLLAAYDDKYKQRDDLLIDSIYHWTSSNKWTGSNSFKSFDDIIKTCNTDSFILPKSEFAPRDIIEVIETFSVKDLQVYADYICERLALIKDSRKRTYGADMAIARLRDDQRELCDNAGYNPKKDYFKYADNHPSLLDFEWEDKIRGHYQQSKKAIEYYQEHYPKMENTHHDQQTESDLSSSNKEALVAEKEQLKQQLAQCFSQVNELSKENAELKEKLAELSEPVENLTADQKVRLAFALNLLKAAGLTDKILDQRGNKAKVATVMLLLTGISSSKNKRGNDAQTCQTFLTDQKYYPRKQNMEILIRLNTLCAELGINACLSLESQSNNKE